MIRSYAYDVEVLPNYFGVTIISVDDYLKTFKNCCDSKGKPIPLVQKLTVKEIIAYINTIEKYTFSITDKNDSQLLQMLGFFNNLRPHYEDIKMKDGNYKSIPIRNDMFGYNTSRYDKLMISGLLMWSNNCNTTKELITRLYELSKKIIELQDNQEMSKKDYFLNNIRKNKLPYTDIDVMTMFALNKVGKGIDKKTGETIYFPKSLKQTSINLQWYELLEYELPPITDIDKHFYNDIPAYRGLTNEQLNSLIDKWDRYIIDDWIPDMEHYNINDVLIVCEMIRLYIDEVKLRYSLSNAYGINVLSSSRSNIADTLFIKFYSEFSNLEPSQWRGKKTERTALSFKKVIFPFISFKTKPLQDLLEEMKKVVIYSVGKDAFQREIKINNLIYTIATGGLHSQDTPRELKSKIKLIDSTKGFSWNNLTDDSFIYTHADVSSFYPSLMSVYEIAPAHINKGCFVKLITWLKDTRVQAKHSKEDFIDGIPKDILAQALKIVINSIYGKLGFERGDICDRLAVLKVTINGQLLLMKLCEELELNGLEVMSANTDGIVVKVLKTKKEIYDKILNDWCEYTKLGLDSEEYKRYINRDINNYAIEEINGKLSYKGALHPTMYMNDLSKGYSMPIVAKAVVEYFINDKPILNTLYEATNILDFCLTQNVGRQFHVEVNYGNKTYISQRNVRFYVSNKGGTIYKVHNDENTKNGLCAGQKITILNTLDDKSITFRDINYGFYYKECLKIIDPIKLNISPNQKGNALKGTSSGKIAIKKKSGQYESLFDDNENS